MATNVESQYRPPSTLAKLAAILFITAATVDATSALCEAMKITALEPARYGATMTADQVKAYDRRERLLAWVELGVGVPTAVVFLMWVYRANRNARALGAGWMTYSPGWSVGCFFIPVANLFMGYRAVREIWRASRPGRGGQPRAPASPLLGAWWTAWVVETVFRGSRQKFLSGDEHLASLAKFPYSAADPLREIAMSRLDSVIEFSWELLVRSVIGCVAPALAAAVVISITDMQENKRSAFVNSTPQQATAAE